MIKGKEGARACHSIILGAGPSGLAAGHELIKHGKGVLVVEKLDRVGGLARTLPFEGCLFDIGPHRFYTKNHEILRLFVETVGEDLVRVPRLTRIHYGEKFFNYPLTPVNAVFGLGIISSSTVLLSYIWSRVCRNILPRRPTTFEEWVTDHFGGCLYRLFFKTYTEKVWGIPCSYIGADWADQRIKNLNLSLAIRNALFKSRATRIKTLADEFLFPRLGAGMFYEKLATAIREKGGRIALSADVVQIRRTGRKIRSVVVQDDGGVPVELKAENFLSSIPITLMVGMLDPPAPDEVREACERLRYRSHLAVNLKIEGNPFPDNWIYVHSREVKMARVVNYRNFSKDMTDATEACPITVEYFTFQGDEVWNLQDNELIQLAAQELEQLKLVKTSQVISGFVVRHEKAYPVIETGFQHPIGIIKTWLDTFENLHPIGRTGMFKYNNQDHAIATGLLAARTILGMGNFDPWLVNIDAEYLEKGPSPFKSPTQEP